MIDEELGQLRAENEREGIGDLIYAALWSAVVPPALRRPAARLAQRAVDTLDHDGQAELVEEFVEYLVTRRRLEEVFDHATSAQHFYALLRGRAIQFLDSKLRTGEAERIDERSQRLLTDSERFAVAGLGNLRRWTLRGRNTEPYGGGPDELRRIGRRLPRPKKFFRRDTEIASRVISDPDLLALVENLLGAADGALTRREIREVLADALNLRAPETVSISRPAYYEEDLTVADIRARGVGQLDDADARLIANDLIGELPARQLQALVLELSGLAREDIARRLGVSPATVGNDLSRVARRVLYVCLGDVELACRVLAQLEAETNTLFGR